VVSQWDAFALQRTDAHAKWDAKAAQLAERRVMKTFGDDPGGVYSVIGGWGDWDSGGGWGFMGGMFGAADQWIGTLG